MSFDDEGEILGLLSSAEAELLGRVGSVCDKVDDDPRTRIERGLRAVLEWVDENPRVARACIVEPTRSTRRVFERREQTLQRLAELLRLNAPPGSSGAPEVLEELLVAGVCEVLGGRFGDGGEAHALDLAPELTELLIGSYPPPAAL